MTVRVICRRAERRLAVPLSHHCTTKTGNLIALQAVATQADNSSGLTHDVLCRIMAAGMKKGCHLLLLLWAWATKLAQAQDWAAGLPDANAIANAAMADARATSSSTPATTTSGARPATPPVVVTPSPTVMTGVALGCTYNPHGRGYYGNDLNAEDASSAADCCSLCHTTDGCAGWTFSGRALGTFPANTCYMHYSISQGLTSEYRSFITSGWPN